MPQVSISPEEPFKAIGDRTRLRIVRLLAMMDQRISVSKLQETLDEPLSKVSRHLKQLRSAGVVELVAVGRWRYYQVNKSSAHVNHLMSAVLAMPDENGVFADDLREAGFEHLAGSSAEVQD